MGATGLHGMNPQTSLHERGRVGVIPEVTQLSLHSRCLQVSFFGEKRKENRHHGLPSVREVVTGSLGFGWNTRVERSLMQFLSSF